MKRYRIRVQRWVCYVDVVTVEAPSERDARAMAMSEAPLKTGYITKNQTTILEELEPKP